MPVGSWPFLAPWKWHSPQYLPIYDTHFPPEVSMIDLPVVLPEDSWPAVVKEEGEARPTAGDPLPELSSHTLNLAIFFFHLNFGFI